MVSVVTLEGVRGWLEGFTLREEPVTRQSGGTLALVHHPGLWLDVDVRLEGAKVFVCGGRVCVQEPVWMVYVDSYLGEHPNVVDKWLLDQTGDECRPMQIWVRNLDEAARNLYVLLRNFQHVTCCGCGKLFTAFPGVERCNTCALTKSKR